MIDAKTIGAYLGLVAALFIFFCSLLVLAAIPIGWVAALVKAMRHIIKRKGAEKQKILPPAL